MDDQHVKFGVVNLDQSRASASKTARLTVAFFVRFRTDIALIGIAPAEAFLARPVV